MSNLRPNRAARRADRRRTAKKLLAMAGSAVTATALTAGVSAPAANAAVHNPDVALAATEITTITTGPLMAVLSALGISSLPLDPLGTLTLDWTESSPQNVYNALNAIPLAPKGSGQTEPCGLFTATDQCRMTPLIATGFGAFGARDAVNAMWRAVTTARFPSSDGQTPFTFQGNILDPGYSIMAGMSQNDSGVIAPDAQATTDVVSIVLNNPLRVNGGVAARFAPLLNSLGIDTSLPETGVQGNCGGAPCDTGKDLPRDSALLISNLIDVTWAYNPLADFPATPNPFALVNSLLGLLPPSYLLSTPVSEIFNDISLTAGVQGIYNAPGTLPPYPDTQSLLAQIGSLLLATPLNLGVQPQLFLTLQNDDLPILSPLRLPAQIINGVLDRLAAAFAPPGSAGLPFRLGTPIADMLQPALKILVNIAYPDVVTPTDVANDPTLVARGYCALGGICYDRTFAQTPTEFSLMGNLTLQEMLQVPGDVLNALVTGFTQQLAKPFFGIIEPAPCVGCAPADAVAPQVAATEPIPGPAVAASATKTVAAEASEPAAEAPAVVAADADRSEAPAATVTAVRSSAAEPGQATGDTDTANRTRGRSSAQAQSASSTEEAGSTEAPTSRRAAAARR